MDLRIGFREVQHLNKGEMTTSSIILLFCDFPILISPSSVNVWLQSGKFYQLFQKNIFRETNIKKTGGMDAKL